MVSLLGISLYDMPPQLPTVTHFSWDAPTAITALTYNGYYVTVTAYKYLLLHYLTAGPHAIRFYLQQVPFVPVPVLQFLAHHLPLPARIPAVPSLPLLLPSFVVGPSSAMQLPSVDTRFGTIFYLFTMKLYFAWFCIPLVCLRSSLATCAVSGFLPIPSPAYPAIYYSCDIILLCF